MSKYPHPWKIEPVGPAEWAVVDANDVQLFNLRADLDYEEQEHQDVFSQETLGEADGPTPLLDQLDELFKKGPK
jgi:hypothetical protein